MPSPQTHYDLIILLPTTSSGGIALKARKVVNHWESTGKSILVIALKTDPENHPFLDYPNLYSLRTSTTNAKEPKNLLASLSRFLKIRKIIKQNPGAKILALGHHSNTIAILAATGLNNRVFVSHFSDPKRSSTTSVSARIMNAVNQRAHLNVANSKGGVSLLQKRNPKGRYAFLPNFIDTQSERIQAGLKQPCILAIGRLVPLKSHHLMIEAFSKISSKFPEWKLVILGEGPKYIQLLEQIEALGLQERINITGFVKETSPYLNRARIFVQYSIFEGFPTSLMEGMAYGCACITADTSPGSLELIQDGQTGLVAQHPDVEDLSKKIAALIESPELMEKLIKNAHAAIKTYDQIPILKIWDQIFWQ